MRAANDDHKDDGLSTFSHEPGAARSSLQEEADALVRRVRSSMSTLESARVLEQWGAASAAHADALARAQRSWDEIRLVGEVYRARQKQGVRTLSQARVAQPARPSRRFFLRTGLVTGGAAAVALAVYPPWDLWPSLFELSADYRTATGQQRRVTLAENVAVELNTHTSLNVNHSANGDIVRLISGEAAFSRDSGGTAMEVVAGVGRMQVAACGFQVRRLAAGVSVTCLQGNVQVRHPAGTVVLHASQQVVYDDTTVGVVRDANAATASAWRRGMLVFRDTPLREVVDEINRYRPGHVVLMNDALGRRVVNGQFQIASLDQVIPHLSDVFGAHVRSLPGGVVILS